MFIKNLVKKGDIIIRSFTVGFEVIWQVVYLYQKKVGQVPILEALQI